MLISLSIPDHHCFLLFQSRLNLVHPQVRGDALDHGSMVAHDPVGILDILQEPSFVSIAQDVVVDPAQSAGQVASGSISSSRGSANEVRTHCTVLLWIPICLAISSVCWPAMNASKVRC